MTKKGFCQNSSSSESAFSPPNHLTFPDEFEDFFHLDPVNNEGMRVSQNRGGLETINSNGSEEANSPYDAKLRARAQLSDELN